MEQAPKTSFIPKQSIGVAKTRERRSFNVVTFFAMVVFLAVLVLSVAVFFYKEYAVANLDVEKRKLAEFKDRFDSNTSDNMREIRMLEDRFMIAEHLLDQHLSISRLFDALEERIQANAQLMSFVYERRPSGEAQVKMGGRALTFNTVALQERGFAVEPAFERGSVVFSGVDTSTEGTEENPIETVQFTVSADVDTAELAYRGFVTQIDSATSTAEEEMVEDLASSTDPAAEADESQN